MTPARAAEQHGVLASGDGAGDLVGLELHDGFGVGVRQSQHRAPDRQALSLRWLAGWRERGPPKMCNLHCKSKSEQISASLG